MQRGSRIICFLQFHFQWCYEEEINATAVLKVTPSEQLLGKFPSIRIRVKFNFQLSVHIHNWVSSAVLFYLFRVLTFRMNFFFNVNALRHMCHTFLKSLAECSARERKTFSYQRRSSDKQKRKTIIDAIRLRLRFVRGADDTFVCNSVSFDCGWICTIFRPINAIWAIAHNFPPVDRIRGRLDQLYHRRDVTQELRNWVTLCRSFIIPSARKANIYPHKLRGRVANESLRTTFCWSLVDTTPKI